MIELFKNIGLGIFVNGAFAWQFGEATVKGFLAILEGIAIMAIAIYIEKKEWMMSGLDYILIAGAFILVYLSIKAYQIFKKPQH